MAKQKINGSQMKNILATRHNNGTKTKQTDVRIEYGWGAYTFPSAAQSAQEVVAFDTAFTETPIVNVTFGGDQTSGAEALGNGQNTVHGFCAAKCTGVSVNGFNAYLWNPSGTWPTGAVVYYHWTAIGR